jgi:sugar phosphate isomerase/epimerase
MNNEITRRNFLSQSTAIVGGGALAPLGVAAAAAQKPIGDVKLSFYSVTYFGLWYRGDPLTMDQMIERAKRFGYDGIEIEAKRPSACPLDWPKKRCDEYRKKFADAGLAISGVAAVNDFSSPIPEHREAELSLVRDSIRMTSDLNAKVLRVFLAWPGATPMPGGGGRYDIAQTIWQFTHDQFTEEQTWAWIRECLVEAARYAGDYGVTLALQNHKPVIKNYKQVLQMVREVGSPHLKVCLDAPLMENKEPAYLRQAVHDVGPLQVQTHFGGEFERKTPGGPILQIKLRGQWRGPYLREGYETYDSNIPFIKALLETGYRGYDAYELCHPLPMVDGKTVGIDFVDQNVRLAAEYFRGVVAEAKKQLAA